MLSLSMQSILAQHRLSLMRSLTALATGSQINQASDNPAGLIASMQLGASLAQVESDMLTTQRSSNVADVADGALSQVSDLLNQAQTLAAANGDSTRSPEEKQANQIQIDSIVSSIDRIGRTTQFNGIPIFDGNLTVSAGFQSLTVTSADPAALGQTQIDGTTYHLSDITSGGSLNATANAQNAAAVISAAQNQVNTQRERIGAFQQDAVAPAMANLATQFENLSSANSQIADTDFAAEMSRMVRSQVLSWSVTSLMKIAGTASGHVVDLLKPTARHAL